MVKQNLDTAIAGLRRRVQDTGRTLKGATPPAKVVMAIFAALLITPLVDHVVPYLVPLRPVWGGTEAYCDKHKLGCDLTTHLLADGALAVLAYLAFWQRSLRIKTIWRRRATRTPDELFTWLGPGTGGLTEIAAVRVTEGGPLPVRLKNAASRRLRRSSLLVQSILGRDELVRELASALDHERHPQVIVADSAAGKTMVLVRLADFLARRGQVPVMLTLQGLNELHFEELARQWFGAVLPHVDENDLKKQWDELRHRGQITVLADDLEKATVTRADVERALDEAAGARLRLVVASRPYGVPADLHEGRIDLQPLRPHEVERDLLRLTRRARAAGSEEAIKRIVAGADISVTPYYLSLSRVLGSLGLLSGSTEDEDVRLWLLKTYRGALEAGAVRPEGGLSIGCRTRRLKDLESVAFARLAGNRTSDAIAEFLRLLEIGTDVPATLDGARRLGVVTKSGEDEARFAHPTTLAYFASCFLADHPEKKDRYLWEIITDLDCGPYRTLTVVFAITAAQDAELARDVCSSLIDADAPGDDMVGARDALGPSWLDAAVEIVRRGNGAERKLGAELLRRVEAALAETHQPVTEQVRLLNGLGELCAKLDMPEGYELLMWYAATPHDYVIRRQAMKALCKSEGAVEALLPVVEEVMFHARRCERWLTEPIYDDRDGPQEELFLSLKAVAWILPCLRSVATGSARDALCRYQWQLLEFASSLTRQRGLEASIAQGLKLDAVQNPDLAPDEFAFLLLADTRRRAVFWFSRLLVVQALALRSKADDTGRADKLIEAVRKDKCEHRLVRETAKLCHRARNAADPGRYLFEDATDIAARAPYELPWATSRLVGDIVLALNLNELGDSESRLAFGEATQLPLCMSSTPDRISVVMVTRPEDLKPPKSDCPFFDEQRGTCLCPYSYDSPNSTYRRELSRAFCRHQRLNAGRVHWHPGLKVKHVREFWAHMERLARY
ncbi:MAG: hypothetical protein ACXVVQ_11855 [Solirubrobacteraceae bacterium]